MSEKDEFLEKFEEKLKKKLKKKTFNSLKSNLNKTFIEEDEELNSSDYEKFRTENLPTSISTYERICNFSEKIFPMKPDKKSEVKFQEQIYKAHLNVTPTGIQSATILFSLIILLFGVFLLALEKSTIGMGIILIGLGMYFAMQKIPDLLAKKIKAKASDEIIIGIFYIVAFMRFSSNFELAISFAANYLSGPLALDFKRILWELENAKYPTVKDAMDKYLEQWRDENLEFLEAIYLIESSLYESEEFRRISLLDKSLDIILQGNYEKMLHFAQELRGKVQTFNMIGIVLPTLGLIILPLAASFGNPKSVWEIVFLLYNLLIPVFVSYFGFLIIFNRPSAVNSIRTPTNIKGLKEMQMYEFKFFRKKSIFISPKIPAITIFLVFLFIGLLPLIIHNIGGEPADATSCNTNLENNINDRLSYIFPTNSPFAKFQDYRPIDKPGLPVYCYGPYGVYPGILSLFLPLSLAFGIGYYLRYKYQRLVHLRDKTKKLEKQFPSATFQLGNRINEGLSAELAFGAVAETMKGTEAGVFFSKIDTNIKFNGMSIELSIFDNEKGAINEYPSDLIMSSMKILIRAIEHGPEITAKTLIDLSRYLTEIHMAQERMMDLLAESLGSMKGQAAFLAPIISGVVVSIVSLITLILGTLSDATEALATQGGGTEGMSGFLGNSIPTYLFQGVVGVYIVLIIILLMYLVTNLESGEDPINTKYQISEKLIGGIIKYAFVVAAGVIGFSFVGAKILVSLV